MNLFVAGVSYKTAPVEVRERLAVSPRHLQCAGCRLRIETGLEEIVVLSTCNRVEIYGAGKKLNVPPETLFRHVTGAPLDLQPYLYHFKNEVAIRHLFAVAGGLDSMVLGETEITGQVKLAYETARQARLTGGTLNRVFQKALQTAKQIRTQTEIGRGSTSVGSAAVELAGKVFDGDLRNKAILIVGAGKMGEACIRHFAKRGVRSVLVSNRSHDRALSLAAEFGGEAVPFAGCLRALAAADIAIISTGSSEALIHQADLQNVMRARRRRPLFLIDIAVPRNVDPAARHVPDVYLFDIDDLNGLVRENVLHRQQELARCRALIEHNTAELAARLNPVLPPPDDLRLQPQPGWVLYGAVARCG